MRHPILAAAIVVVLAACGNAPVAEPRPVTVGNIAVRENWRSTVIVDRVDSILLTMPSGDHQLQRYRRVAAFTLQVDASGAVLIRLDSLRTVPAAPIDSDLLVGATWTGRLEDLSVNALHLSGKSGANALTPMVKNLLPRLPSGGARPRAGWSDSATGRSWSDIFAVSERRTAKWSTGSLGRGDSGQLLPVKLSEEFEQIGEGSQDGRKLTMTSQGRRSGIYYVSASGEVSSAELTDSAAVSIGVPATRQLMSGVRFTRTDIRFITPGAERSGITVGTTHRR